jgi:hypothetical protein
MAYLQGYLRVFSGLKGASSSYQSRDFLTAAGAMQARKSRALDGSLETVALARCCEDGVNEHRILQAGSPR